MFIYGIYQFLLAGMKQFFVFFTDHFKVDLKLHELYSLLVISCFVDYTFNNCSGMTPFLFEFFYELFL